MVGQEKLRIAIAIDKWKLPIFKRHLDKAKYAFQTSAGLTPEMLILTVFTDNPKLLEVICRSAQKEAARKRYVH